MPANIEQDILLEQKAQDTFRGFLKDNRDLLRRIAHWGDGKCAFLTTMCREELLGITLEDEINTVAQKCKTVSQVLRWRIFKRDGYQCCECGSEVDLTFDHIIPQSKGGDDSEENLRTLCRSCNSIKGARS